MTTQNRQPVLRCVLSNAAHPEYGQVTIPFPIPVMEYERTLELLAAMELGARLKRDCRVDELESGFPILKRLEKVGANLDELDYLARRLDGFDDYEAAQFQAMAVRLGTFDMTDFINLTFCGQQATVITDFSDLDAVGRQHYMTLEGGCASEEELEQVDGRAAALKLILNKHGTIRRRGGAWPASRLAGSIGRVCRPDSRSGGWRGCGGTGPGAGGPPADGVLGYDKDHHPSRDHRTHRNQRGRRMDGVHPAHHHHPQDAGRYAGVLSIH